MGFLKRSALSSTWPEISIARHPVASTLCDECTPTAESQLKCLKYVLSQVKEGLVARPMIGRVYIAQEHY